MKREQFRKLRKLNIKLYWHNVVLKTNIKQEKSRGSSSSSQ
jgi:hypothetical protein